MPEKETIERAKEDEREGKSPSTQAGEFVREEMHHVREGKHGARSPQQAIAIGLSKARRAGVKLRAPKAGRASAQTRTKAQRDIRKGQSSKAIGNAFACHLACAQAGTALIGIPEESCAAGAYRGAKTRQHLTPSGSDESSSDQGQDRLEAGST